MLRTNALGLQPGERGTHLVFRGPHAASIDAGKALMASGRMQEVTFDSLRAIGLRDFGWLNPAENPDGRALVRRREGTMTHPHGAFVYAHVPPSGVANAHSEALLTYCYYTLAVVDDDDPGAGAADELLDEEIDEEQVPPALDEALRGNIAHMRNTARKHVLPLKRGALSGASLQMSLLADQVMALPANLRG